MYIQDRPVAEFVTNLGMGSKRGKAVLAKYGREYFVELRKRRRTSADVEPCERAASEIAQAAVGERYTASTLQGCQTDYHFEPNVRTTLR